ncbi:MAG: hypothetical protein JOZ75_13910 [Candidatus Dormibacteraeota bacterium]|nr:hypothetical protein [Candidatus Dormibacteraeota bacterium]
MPWTLVLRYIVRIVAGLLFWRLTTARRAAQSTAAPQYGRPPAAPPPPPRLAQNPLAARLRETASLGWRAFSAVVLLVATALLTSGGVTLTALSPRWLGIAMLVLAAVALTAAVVDLLGVRTLLRARRRRISAEALRRQVG